MAVNLSVQELSNALRIGDSPEELSEATRLLTYATEAVQKYAPSATDAAHNEAAIRLSGYLYDQPNSGRGLSFAHAGRNSGAWAILLAYRIHRAGSTSAAIAEADQAVGSAGNPVVGVDVQGDELIITFADSSTRTEALPGGGGGYVVGDVANGRLPSIVPVELRVNWVSALGTPINAASFAAVGGANIGNQIDGVAVPDYPVTYPGQYAAIVIWLEGDAIPTSITPNYPSFGREGVSSTSLRVGGADGVYWVSTALAHAGNAGQVVRIVLPGELLATQAWTQEQLDALPAGGGGGSGVTEAQATALISPFARDTWVDTDFLPPERMGESPVDDTIPVVVGGGRSFRFTEVSALLSSLSGSANRITVGSTAHADPQNDDIWLRDIQNTPPEPGHTVTVFERAAGSWREEFRWSTAPNFTETEAIAAAMSAVENWAQIHDTTPIPADKLTLAPGAMGGDDAYPWATEGNDTLLVPTDKINFDPLQNQIDEIVNELGHSQGTITAVVGVLGSGDSSIRYTLPNNLDGLYDVSVRVKARVQVNEFANISGNLHIVEDGGLGLNTEIPTKTHNYRHAHEGVVNFLRKGLAVSPGANHLTFSALVTGQSPPDVHFIEVENLTLTNTSLVNAGNVDPFIADWAEDGNSDPVPDPKLSGVKQWALESSPPLDVPTAEDIGTFDNADIAAIANQEEQLFVLEALVQRDADGTLATITRGWEPSADAGVAGPQPLGTANLTITTAVVFHATGITLTTAHTWAYISMDTHEEDVGGLVGHYAPGPWLRILVSDLLGLVDVTTATTPTSVNSIHSEVEIQNFREVDIGTTATGEMLVSIPHKNSNSTITGPLRVMVE